MTITFMHFAGVVHKANTSTFSGEFLKISKAVFYSLKDDCYGHRNK